MKYGCTLIQDIMPLYKDKALSEKSIEIITEHLSECEDCRKTFKEIQSDNEGVSENNSLEGSEITSKFSKKIKRTRILIAALVISFIFIVTASFISHIKFKTPNFLASGIGVFRVCVTDAELVEIQKSPRIIISKPDDAMQLFIDTIESEGYTYLEEERMGSMCVIEKDGVKEYIHFSVNGYFSKWVWN